MFLETFPFLLGCRICWHVIIPSIPLWFFVFLQYQLLSLLFHLLLCLFGFSFLLVELGQQFVSLVYPFKEPALGFIEFFFYCFLFSSQFISSLIVIISFVLTLGFVCSSFSNSFK